MSCNRVCILAILLAISAGATSAQPSQADQQRRVQRIAGIIRLWGQVKYFHPAMTQRPINWDSVFTTAVMSVGPSASKESYRRTVQSMLSALGDPRTRVRPEAQTAVDVARRDTYDLAPGASIRWLDGTVVIDGAAITDYFARNQFDAIGDNRRLMAAALDSAGAAILDLRFDLDRTAAREPYLRAYALDQFLAARLPLFLNAPVQLGSIRTRLHSGYPPDRGTTSGGYYSGTLTTTPTAIVAARTAATPLRIVVLVDSTTPDVSPYLIALRSAGATVVVEGSTTYGEGGGSAILSVADELNVELRTGELVDASGMRAIPHDTVIAAGARRDDGALRLALRLASGTSRGPTEQTGSTPLRTYAGIESAYDTSTYPPRGLRLLALARYWNVINYFFPYKHLIDDSWDRVLPTFIPRFEAARDSFEYAIAIAHLSTTIQDMHGFVDNPVLDDDIGRAVPAVTVRPIEGRAIIVDAARDAIDAGIKIGDEVLTIDDMPVAVRMSILQPLYSASTPQSMEIRMYSKLLAGKPGSTVRVAVQRAGESPRMMMLSRDAFARAPQRSTPVYRVLPDGYGYADLDRLAHADVPRMMDSLRDTPAIIFDMRGYPDGTAWAITPYLIDTTTVVAQFRRPQWLASELAMGTDPSSVAFDQTIAPGAQRYRGQIVVLINADAGSQAEGTCLFLEAAADATFVGSRTMGVNGDITNVLLPGGILASFSGHDIRHADGRQLQRVGIEPHIPVSPTVAGIREGRDEILEAAVAYLRSGTTRPTIPTPRPSGRPR